MQQYMYNETPSHFKKFFLDKKIEEKSEKATILNICILLKEQKLP